MAHESSYPDAARMPTRRQLLGMAGAVAALGLGGCAAPQSSPAARGGIAPFSTAEELGELPPGWEPYVLRRDLPRTDYRVSALDGRRVLHAASGTGGTSGLRCGCVGDPVATPKLRWSWQVAGVPDGLCVGERDTDDSPARVALGFDGDHTTLNNRDRAFYELVELFTGHRLPYATLMYVWDARLPVGTVVSNARTQRIRYLVVESGAARAGQWLSYERDAAKDYQQVFGEEPGPLLNAGVLTDSDDLHIELQAWYGDITLSAA
ncbi:DUF3047 domain-containing protein [Ramlibacter humi]|nr:DUF3047 domain-containing protein [Ramlibacter humi]